jgi:hypothetical protein
MGCVYAHPLPFFHSSNYRSSSFSLLLLLLFVFLSQGLLIYPRLALNLNSSALASRVLRLLQGCTTMLDSSFVLDSVVVTVVSAQLRECVCVCVCVSPAWQALVAQPCRVNIVQCCAGFGGMAGKTEMAQGWGTRPWYCQIGYSGPLAPWSRFILIIN